MITFLSWFSFKYSSYSLSIVDDYHSHFNQYLDGTENTTVYKFTQPSYSDKKINLKNFNYKNKCREPFKYKPNNKRDLVFTGMRYTDMKKWKEHKQTIEYTSRLMKNTIPNARKVCVIYDDNDEMKRFLKECGYEPYLAKIKEEEKSEINAAIDRFIQLSNYLKEHEGEIDRIALIDVRDILWFADGFQTVSDDEVMFTKECIYYSEVNKVCNTYPQRLNSWWLRITYGDRIVEKFENENKEIVNVGFIIGGIKPFRQLLNVFVDEIHFKNEYLKHTGIDNAMLNYLYYTERFKEINVTVNTYSQRFAFTRRGGYDYDSEKKSITMTLDGCSPIIRHKLSGNSLLSLIS